MKRFRSGFVLRRVDLALTLGLFLFAVLLRLPNLYLIPRFTDEVLEWQLGFRDCARHR